MDIKILYEDNDIIVCIKPHGIPSQSDKTNDIDMVNILKNHVFESENKTPYIALINRLDRPVSGIMLFAKNKSSANILTKQMRLNQIHKRYIAIVMADLSSYLEKGKIELVDYISKDKNNLSRISNQSDKNAKKAVLYFTVNKVFKDEDNKILSLVEIELITGRHHQIRVQMSSRGMPLVGDTKYNSYYKDKKGWFELKLFAYELEFEHPKSKKKMKFIYNSELV